MNLDPWSRPQSRPVLQVRRSLLFPRGWQPSVLLGQLGLSCLLQSCPFQGLKQSLSSLQGIRFRDVNDLRSGNRLLDEQLLLSFAWCALRANFQTCLDSSTGEGHYCFWCRLLWFTGIAQVLYAVNHTSSGSSPLWTYCWSCLGCREASFCTGFRVCELVLQENCKSELGEYCFRPLR